MELVDAETLEPYREHTKADDGSHYVEVEPNKQYWIRVKSHLPASQRCICRFEVDGTSLGYRKDMKGGIEIDAGIWSRSGLMSTYRALQFKPIPPDKPSSNSDSIRSFWMGSIKVKLYEAIRDGRKMLNDVESNWKGKSVTGCGVSGKKAVSSVPGTKIKVKTHRSGRNGSSIGVESCWKP